MIAYVVGGGPSADEFEWTAERRQATTIACHAAAERLPFAPTYQLSVDRPFWEQNEPRWGSLGVWVTGSGGGSRVAKSVAWVPCVAGEDHWALRWGEHVGEGVAVGGSSGVAAMNFAYCLGASEIHLVGIDLEPQDDGRPWYRLQAGFRYAATQCRLRGVKVVSHGRFQA